MLDVHGTDVLVRLMALASRLEREGQYNVAKLARAAADAVVRRAAYARELPGDKQVLADATEQLAADLTTFDVGAELVAALRVGAQALADGRFTLIDETPDAYVCRTCGYAVVKAPPVHCRTCGAWPETFQRWLPVYWLNELDPPAALERLRQTPSAVAALIEGIPEDALSHEPAPGAWSLHQAVTHLRDAQGVLAYRLERMLAEENPALTALAVYAWAQNQAEQHPTTQEIFAEYLAARAQLLARLMAIPLADWWRIGQHEEFGAVSIRQQVSYFAAHEATHLAQMEALAKGARGVQST